MHILIILGSPRQNGNSEILARSLADGATQTPAASVEFIRLNDLRITPCQGCGGCSSTGVCIIDDDMTLCYEKVDACDALIMVSPIYFYALSAQCKAFVDRFQARWARKYLCGIPFRPEAKRQGFLLATAATNGKKVFDGAVLTSKILFDALDLDFGGSILAPGVDTLGAITTQPHPLEQAAALGRIIASGSREKFPA